MGPLILDLWLFFYPLFIYSSTFLFEIFDLKVQTIFY